MNDHDQRNPDRTDRSQWASALDVTPDPDLEERTVALLRRKRVLRAPGSPPWIYYARMAAAIGIIFAAGLATGVILTTRTYAEQTPPGDSATRVRRAGSEYVEALAAARAFDSASAAVSEAALATFAGAARELERLAGSDAVAERITAVLMHPLRIDATALGDLSVEVTGPARTERLSDRVLVRTNDGAVTVVIRDER